MPTISWNNQVRLVLADVDDTIAPAYEMASPEMIAELSKLLRAGVVLFMISGSSVADISRRIIDRITPNLRYRIVVGHCNGAEVWQYNQSGDLNTSLVMSLYDSRLNSDQKMRFRDVIQELIREFNFTIYPPMARPEFRTTTAGHPLAIMLDDKGPLISLGLHNATNLQPNQIALLEIEVPRGKEGHDLRVVVMDRANELFSQYDLPIAAYRAGTASIDIGIKDVTKTTAVEFVLNQSDLFKSRGLSPSELLHNPKTIEVWGDRFSQSMGTDWLMSAALDKQVRSIDFRDEDPADFPPGYNIVIWDGQERLYDGLLEYLQSR